MQKYFLESNFISSSKFYNFLCFFVVTKVYMFVDLCASFSCPIHLINNKNLQNPLIEHRWYIH